MKNYFLKSLMTLLLFSIMQTGFAQVPQKMSYQAVIRDAGNAAVINTIVGMRISILQGSASGTPVYVETQTPMTNAVGLVTTEIGTGTVVSGTFSNINWSTGLYWIKTETDPLGGTAYSILGNSQLSSVPYALFAGSSSGAWKTAGNSGTLDGSNFIGTTDNIPLTFRVNNQQSGRLDHILSNSFWGYQAGISNTTAANNTASGNKALFANSTGSSNTANGSKALISSTTGDENTAIGADALRSNITGSFNTATGNASLHFNTSGISNSAFGAYSLYSNTTGFQNTAVGLSALSNNNGGSSNTGIGFAANVASSLINATAIGAQARADGNNSMVLGSINGINGATASVNVGIGTTAPANTLSIGASSQFQVNNTGNLVKLNNIATSFPAVQGAANTFLQNDGSGNLNWAAVASSGWGLSGNSGTVDGTNFIGTTDNIPLTFKVNNQQAGRIDHLKFNTFLGYQAGLSNSSGTYNIANGNQALYSNTTGHSNAANGFSSLLFNTTGYHNTADGFSALTKNTVGYQNTANGSRALSNNTTGINNTASGFLALSQNTAGSSLTGIGYQANVANGALTNATAVGAQAFVSADNSLVLGSINGINGATASVNVGIGTTAPANTLSIGASSQFQVNSTGNLVKLNNIATSFPAVQGAANTFLQNDGSGNLNWAAVASSGWGLSGNSGTVDGTNFIGTMDNIPLTLKVNNQQAGRIDHLKGNTFLGYKSGLSNTTGTNNTANGTSALLSNTTGSFNSANGESALYSNTTGSDNTANGYRALYLNTGGVYNTANGNNALYTNTTGSHNTANGSDALHNNTIGNYNAANGDGALYHNTTGSENTANGYNTLYLNTTGAQNTANGLNALYSNTTGSFNTANGFSALYSNTSGDHNTAIGHQALYFNTTGYVNTASGYFALRSNTTGNSNTANGFVALSLNTTGIQNTALGQEALASNTTGSNNTAVGFKAEVSNGALTNATAIGANAIVNASNKMRLGSTGVTVIEGQVAYSFPSDARFKYNIQANVPGLAFINKLKPVTYFFDEQKMLNYTKTGQLSNNVSFITTVGYDDTPKTLHTGFLAQDIEKICRELGYTFDGLHLPDNDRDHYSLAYSQFIMPLVKGMQEQQLQIVEQKQINKQQSEKLQQLQSQIEELKQLVEKLK